jgi:hypothetical protein
MSCNREEKVRRRRRRRRGRGQRDRVGGDIRDQSLII